MKRSKLSFTLALVLFFQVSSNICAQDIKADSLFVLLENYSLRDTHRVNLISRYTNITNADRLEENIPLLKEGLAISKEINYLQGIGDINNVYCALYLSKSNVELALKHGLKAEKIYRELNSVQDILSVNTNLARVYAATKDYESALQINLNNIDLVKDDEATIGKARIYFFTGNSYNILENYEKAEIYYLEAKGISIAINDKQGEIVSNGSLANIYNNSGQYEKALPIIKETLDFANSINSKSMIAASYKILSDCYGGLKNYENAITFNQKAIDLYGDLGRLKILENLYRSRSQYHESLGDHKAANEFLKQYYITKDSIFPIEKAKVVEDLKTKYETEKITQQKELAEAQGKISEEKAKRSRLLSLGALLFAGVVTFLIGFIFNRLKLIRKQKGELDSAYAQLEEAKKNELAVSNLKALQSQMNPHFIFNALNSVQDLVLLKDIRNSNRYLGKFSDLIRKILLSSKEQFITLEEEIEILTLYLDLEKLRFGEDFIVELNCNVSQEKQEEIKLPAMFIQPYIENAIKHGLFHKQGEKHLLVAFTLFPNYLECIVNDNGIGQERAAEMKIKNLHLHTGFSTEAIAERIRLLNETLNQKIELAVEDLIENDLAIGTKIILKFPLSNLW